MRKQEWMFIAVIIATVFSLWQYSAYQDHQRAESAQQAESQHGTQADKAQTN